MSPLSELMESINEPYEIPTGVIYGSTISAPQVIATRSTESQVPLKPTYKDSSPTDSLERLIRQHLKNLMPDKIMEYVEILDSYGKRLKAGEEFTQSELEELLNIREMALCNISNNEKNKFLFQECNNLLKKYYEIEVEKFYGKQMTYQEKIEYNNLNYLIGKIDDRKRYNFLKDECYELAKEIVVFSEKIAQKYMEYQDETI